MTMTTRKPTFLDRIIGHFRLCKYMKYFNRELGLRTVALEEIKAEQAARPAPTLPKRKETPVEEYYEIPSVSNKDGWTPQKRVVYTPPRDSRGRFIKIR
jgi:hypothetical protein